MAVEEKTGPLTLMAAAWAGGAATALDPAGGQVYFEAQTPEVLAA